MDSTPKICTGDNNINVYISDSAPAYLSGWLTSAGRRVIPVHETKRVYKAVASHADVQMCKMGVNYYSPLIRASLDSLGYSYPMNIRYNAVCLDRYIVHNLKYTAQEILEAASRLGLERINVKQGYTKCSTVVVNGTSVITADTGIARELQKLPDVDVLLIREGHVRLDGFPYGFLGGASGRIGDAIVFCGDITTHPDYKAIDGFIRMRGIKIINFQDQELTDIGSIIESCY